MKTVIKKRILLLSTLLICLTAAVHGQNGKHGAPEDSVQCLESLNLFGDDIKAKNYKSAVIHWRTAVTICPKASKNLYINGAKMLKSLIKEEADEAKKTILIDSLFWLYAERIKNFGQEGYVKGRWAGDVYKYKKDINGAYDLAANSYELEQNKTDANTVNIYFRTAFSKYKKKELEKEFIMELYLKLSDVVSANLGDARKVPSYKIVQEGMDKKFADLANCEDLIGVFQPRFDATPEDIGMLKTITKLLDKVDCTDSELFYGASVKLDALDPSETSKYNLGKMSMGKKKYSAALDYFKAAVELASDGEKKGKYLFKAAEAYKALGQKPTARTYAKKAIAARPGWGIPYILIGDLYAISGKECGEEGKDVKKGSVQWAAYDMYKKAKSVDSGVAGVANKKMEQAKSRFPDTEKLFFEGVEVGAAFTVECWINETTIVRAR
ncbi:MAG: hypothetical protein HRT71_16775 [Flavobacteriales bacterium]|nr:hypothetical protein [Flavobacteriales bacterium]